MLYLQQILLLLLVAASTQLSDDCSMLQATELGSFFSYTSTGLVPSVLISVLGSSNSSTYLMSSYQIVCSAQGSGLDLYRMVSVIVSYSLPNGTSLIGQFHFQCERNEWSINVLNDVQNSYFMPPLVGSLAASLKTNCQLCTDAYPDHTAEEHCVQCPSQCTNANRCDASGICCNMFALSGACSNHTCPGNSTLDSNFQCICNPGYTNDNNAECVEINECVSSPCQNGGTCIDEVDSFSCNCLDFFEGSTCEECKLSLCKTCFLNTTTNETGCSECVSGYGFNITQCQKCEIHNCQTCSTISSCQECEQDYQFSTDGLACIFSKSNDASITLWILIPIVSANGVLIVLIALVAIFRYSQQVRANRTRVRPF